jgi:CO/xanthine dehydrogenase FAD-binding subunit
VALAFLLAANAVLVYLHVAVASLDNGAARVAGGGIAEVRIAYGSMGPAPVRCRETERRVVAGEEWTLGELAPITDVRSTAEYRARVAEALLRGFVRDAAI